MAGRPQVVALGHGLRRRFHHQEPNRHAEYRSERCRAQREVDNGMGEDGGRRDGRGPGVGRGGPPTPCPNRAPAPPNQEGKKQQHARQPGFQSNFQIIIVGVIDEEAIDGGRILLLSIDAGETANPAASPTEFADRGCGGRPDLLSGADRRIARASVAMAAYVFPDTRSYSPVSMRSPLPGLYIFATDQPTPNGFEGNRLLSIDDVNA